MNEYFKLTFPYRWTFKTFFKNIDWFFNELKWYYQRAVRGYADCDVWGFDHYLAKIIYGGLVQLKSIKNSYPPDLTFKEWNKILSSMIEGFKAANEILNDDTLFKECEIGNMKKPKITLRKISNMEYIETLKIDYNKYKKEIKLREDKLKTAIDLFKERFFDLWD